MRKKKKYPEIIISQKFIILLSFIICFLAGLAFLIPIVAIILNINNLENLSPIAFSELAPGKVVKIEAVPLDDKLVKTSFKETPCIFYRTCYKEYYGKGRKLNFRRCRTAFGKQPLRFKSENKIYSFKINDLSPLLFMEEDNTYLRNKKTGKYDITHKKKFEAQDSIIRERIVFPREKVTLYGTLSNINLDKSSNTYSLNFIKPENINIMEDPLSYFKNLFDNKLFVVSTKKNFSLVKDEIFKLKAEKLVIFAIIFFILSIIQLVIFFKISKKL